MRIKRDKDDHGLAFLKKNYTQFPTLLLLYLLTIVVPQIWRTSANHKQIISSEFYYLKDIFIELPRCLYQTRNIHDCGTRANLVSKPFPKWLFWDPSLIISVPVDTKHILCSPYLKKAICHNRCNHTCLHKCTSLCGRADTGQNSRFSHHRSWCYRLS